jgi:UDPglucose 6-dehydrogenase
VFAGVADGNAAHKHWTRRKLLALLADEDASGADALAGQRVAIWGLTYKAGTNTLRRSSAVELCRWLVSAGAQVRAHDPAISTLPAELEQVELCSSPLQATVAADVLVVCTAWSDYLHVDVEEILSSLALAQVIDPAGVLRAALAADPRVRYLSVGASSEIAPLSEARR